MKLAPCDAPTLRTERLILRARRAEDFPAYRSWWADPDVAARISGVPLSEEDAWIKFTRMSGLWALLGYGFWLVEEAASGEPVGECGAGELKRDIEPSMIGKPEFGWLFAAKTHGRGYATEAARAAIAWIEEAMPDATMTCMIDPLNAPSIRVAEKCGFREKTRAPYRGKTIIMFERPPGSGGEEG